MTTCKVLRNRMLLDTFSDVVYMFTNTYREGSDCSADILFASEAGDQINYIFSCTGNTFSNCIPFGSNCGGKRASFSATCSIDLA